MNNVYVGYFHTRKSPDKIQKLYAFNAVAQAEGIGFYYFTPRRVNLEDKTIRGLVYEDGAWRERLFPFPNVIYNDSYPKYEWGQAVIEKLYESIPYTSHAVGDKMTVYRKLKKGRQFAAHLIPSKRVSSVGAVTSALRDHGDIILKPLHGRQGIGVQRVRTNEGNYVVQDRESERVLSARQLKQYLLTYMAEEELLVQPFIVCRSKRGSTYDFRLHVQKNGLGQWGVTSIYPRIAAEQGVIPNLSSGGYTMMPKHFFKQEFGEDAEQTRAELADFALRLAQHMDDVYGESFDELGIDIGLDQQQRIWIFELNWRPGPPPIWNVELDVARNSLRYACFLASQR